MTFRESFSTVSSPLEACKHLGPILGVDTGSRTATLALIDHGEVIAEVVASLRSHGAGLPGAVQDLLESSGVTFSQLTGLAVGIGPGSFTGLRVGISYVKGLALALNLPVAGVPSFDAIALCATHAARLPSGASVAVIIDARKAEVFAGLYHVGHNALEKSQEGCQVVSLPVLSRHLDDGVLLVGDARATELSGLMESTGRRCSVIALEVLDQRGRYVAGLGGEKLARGLPDPVVTLEPLYVRAIEKTFRAAPSVVDKERANGEQRRRADSATG
jgi:tRNA threonylcarbamoyladenosine biosynthesis protein TsaB